MTEAVCYKCGARKFGAFVPCPECHVAPKTEDALVMSLALTDHYFDLDVLSEIAESIRADGEPPNLDADSREHLLKQIRDNAWTLSILGLESDTSESIGNNVKDLAGAHKQHDLAGDDSNEMGQLIEEWLSDDTNKPLGSTVADRSTTHDLSNPVIGDIHQLAKLIATSLNNDTALRHVKRLLKEINLHLRHVKFPGSSFLDQIRPPHPNLHSIGLLAIASDCLRFICTAIRADEEVSAGELSVAYTLVEPLTQVYSSTLERYSEFDDLSSDQVGEFLDRFIKDEASFGGSQKCDTFLLGGTLCSTLIVLNGDSNALDMYEHIIFTIQTEIMRVGGMNTEEKETIQATREYTRLLRNVVTGNQERNPAASKVKPSSNTPFQTQPYNPAPEPETIVARPEMKTDPKAALDDAIAELNALTGLSGVKAEVKRLMSFLKIQLERRKHGLRESGQTLHFVFTGNPGTGKTTVARIVSKILYGFGLLKTTKVVECDRSDLVGGYLGQTAIKTDEKIESALDGVLFIDEAYTLAGDALTYGHGDMYGDEAINTLLKRMEDSRDRLVVIAAGYPAPMQKFIRANPGLESRFTRYINFEDYAIADLCQIFEKFCRDAEYSLSPSGRAWASILFTIAYNQRDERFGNARFIRNVFERAMSLHSERLADMPDELVTKEMLVILDGNDLSFEFVRNADRNQIDASNARWLAECPNCGTRSRGTSKVLGRRMSCKECGEVFLFPWWSLEPNTVKGVSAEMLQGSSDQRGTFEAKTVEAKPPRASSPPVEAPAILVLPPSDGWAEDPIRGQALLAEGIEYLQRGSVKRAIRCFDDAIKADWDGSNPSNQHYFLCRAKAYELDGQERPMQALAEYNAAAHAASLGHYRESEERFLHSIELDPEFPWASNNLAWRFATAADAAARNGTRAVQYATCACRKADWHCWSFIDTLAASYAEVGEFSMAIKCSERALLLAPSRCRRGLEEMLEYFRAGKPFRDNT